MGRGRRRRQPNPFEIIGPIAALIFILVFLAPVFFEALVRLAISILICAVVVLVLFLVIRKVVRSRRGQSGLMQPLTASPDRPEKPPVYLNPFENIPRSEWGVEKSAAWVAEFAQGQSLEETEPTRLPSLQERLRAIDWFQFEKLVEILYRQRGYDVERLGGANPDGGIDLIVERDGERVAVQCKHWRREDVKLAQMREFLGALTDSGISKGVFVTLEGFTTDAKQLAIKHGIEIVNEGNLVTLISELDTSGKAEVSVLFSDKRKFCPKCESEMVLRRPGKGEKWEPFWGCSNYPRCRYILRNA